MNTVAAQAATKPFPTHHTESVGVAAGAYSTGGAAPATTGNNIHSSPISTSPGVSFPTTTEENKSPVPPLDQLPLEVLSLVASLVAPPFYPPPPPEDVQPTPELYVIASLDPEPSSPKSVSAELSAITKSCSHVLEASRPWLWENIDVRSGKGWLAVVDALTEVVGDDEEPLSPGVHSDGTTSPLGSPFFPPVPSMAASGPSYPVPGMSSKGSSVAASLNGAVTPPPEATDDSQPSQMVPSVPVGSGLPFQRSVTLDQGAVQRLYDRPRTASTGLPQPRRLSVLQNTPPGSRNVSPSARLRGRSRSPRRGLDFDTEGISSVLSRSLSLSLPGGYHPLMRQSSLSRVLTCSAVEEPPSPEPVTPPEPAFHPDDNPNPEMLPPPGPYIRHLSFTNFRTIGARRSQEEAVRNRFVTAGRLEGVIKNAPNLRSICMTPYVDSSLSYPVLEEIFFRGYPKPRVFRHRSVSFSPSTRARSVSQHPAAEPGLSTMDDQLEPPRPVYVPYEDETEEQKWHRRRMFTPIEALDLTGCVSRDFTSAARTLGENWLDLGIDEGEDDEERGRGRSRRRLAESTDEDEEGNLIERRSHRPLFPALRRLSLRTCTTLQPEFIHSLVLSMPNLTHLDLSGTNVNDSLLRALTYNAPRGMRLQSLSLARCAHLTPSAIVDFLIESPVVKTLLELNLFVHPTQVNAIESDDLLRLLKSAPCIRSGQLRYLDLSSAGFTPEHLQPDVFHPQPSLVSFGLCHVPSLPLREIAAFLQNSARGVEVLAITGTSIEDLQPNATTLQTTLTLHALLINPLTTIPFSLSGLNFSATAKNVDLSAGPTRLRAVELSGAIRRSLVPSQGSGRTEWQVIKSKLGRGWYVDVSAGWIPSDTVDQWGYIPQTSPPPKAGEGRSSLTFVRHLPASHIRRQYLAYLAAADGRVPTDVGWHSRKMEVVKGYGMMGREEGMGGSGAYSSNE